MPLVYFIVKGRIDFYLEHYKIVYKAIVTGTYLGDYEVMHNVLRQHTTRSKGTSNLLTLSKAVSQDSDCRRTKP
jgi:hypothetical protein